MNGTARRRNRHGAWYALIRSCLLMAVVFGTTFEGTAQIKRWLPDTTERPNISPMHGLPLDSFMIAGVPTKWIGTDPHVGFDSVAWMWQFADSMGFDVMQVGVGLNQALVFDRLDTSPFRRPNHRAMIGFPRVFDGGEGREVEFYPFDSTESPYWIAKFTQRVGGAKAYSESPDLDEVGLGMQEYTSATATAWGLIGSEIGLNLDETGGVRDLTTNNTLLDESRATGLYDIGTTFYFAVRANLVGTLNGAIPDDSAIFRVEVWHEIPSGSPYLTLGGTPVTAQIDTAILLRTFDVTKGQLRTPVGGDPDLRFWRTIVFDADMTGRDDGGPGPLNINQQPGVSHALDIRVRWSGLEDARLRSIAFRDRLGELTHGDRTEAQTFRQQALDAARRAVFGPSLDPADDREWIISLECGTEQSFNESMYAGFDEMDRLIRQTFPRGTDVGDSLIAKSFIGPVAHRGFPTFIATTQQRAMYNYLYLNDPRDTVWSDWGNEIQEALGLPHHQIPTLPEMNGGRFHLPELVIDGISITQARSNIEDYSHVLQRSFFGRNDPDIPSLFPYNGYHAMFGGLGQSARTMREVGGRLICLPGSIFHLQIDTIETGTPNVYTTDTLLSHQPTHEELKAMTNAALAYGARGVHHYLLVSQPGLMDLVQAGGDSFWRTNAEQCCFGACGFVSSDTVQNTVASFDLFRTYPPIVGQQPVTTIPDFYIGWQDRSRWIKWINRAWLPDVGRELMKLRWRDAYSIHWQVPRPGTIDTNTTYFTPRPLPSSEFISSITTKSPWTGQYDAPYETYVELGLFETVNRATPGNPFRDTNYAYIVNRRTFARPWWVNETSARGQRMDSLTETRLVTITFDLSHPAEEDADYEQYAFIRVQEVIKDPTVPLPYGSAPPPIDTVIRRDDSITLVMAPGAASLLRITYMPPDESIIAGDIRFNNGKKLVFAGNRYYSVYTRYQGSESTSFFDTVYCRRSFPMSDPAGSILWEPVEHAVSLKHAPFDTTRWQNRWPSLVVRAQGNANLRDTIISITWSCEQAQPFASQREIVMRDLIFWYDPGGGLIPPSSGSYWTPIRHVDWYAGEQRTQWGTPVIGAIDAGEVIVWSDSLTGIEARVRAHNTDYTGYPLTPPDVAILSPVRQVSIALTQQYGQAGQFPTVSSYGNRASQDSTLGIAWQQRVGGGATDIVYKRVRHDSTVLNGVRLWLTPPPPLFVTQGSGQHMHPSLTLVQRPYNYRQEILVWESIVPLALPPGIQPEITAQELGTPSSGFTFPSGLPSSLRFQPGGLGRAYPSVSALTTTGTPWVSIAFNNGLYDWDLNMYQTTVNGNSVDLWGGMQGEYTYGGYHPATAESWHTQNKRQAVLYQNTPNPFTSPGILRTTREFFTKFGRPTGYIADGRSTTIMLDDSTRTGFNISLMDVWQASGVGSASLAMPEFVADTPGVDDLSAVSEILRTETFGAGDSTTLGFELYGATTGGGAIGSAWVDVLAELIDSTSGARIAVLDSFRLSTVNDSVSLSIRRDLDLLSGRYYVRLRLDTGDLSAVRVRSLDRRYPIGQASLYIVDTTAAKRTATSVPGAPTIRVDVQPNPFTAATEIRYSVPEAGRVSVMVHDERGREVARLIDGEEMEAGRYSAGFTAGELATGAYLIEVRLERHGVVRARSVERIVLQR